MKKLKKERKNKLQLDKSEILQTVNLIISSTP